MNFFATILAGGIGAFLAHFAGQYVQAMVRRKQRVETERDDDLSLLLSAVEDARSDLVEYWSHDRSVLGIREHILAARVVARMMTISHILVELLSEDYLPMKSALIEQKRFNDAGTGGDFLVSERLADLHRIREVEICAEALRNNSRRRRKRLRVHWLA